MTMREKMAMEMAKKAGARDWYAMSELFRNAWIGLADAALAALEELFATAAECANDLAEHLDAEHQHRHQYPTIQRSYDRDMDVVVRLRAMIGAARGEG